MRRGAPDDHLNELMNSAHDRDRTGQTDQVNMDMRFTKRVNLDSAYFMTLQSKGLSFLKVCRLQRAVSIIEFLHVK